ncbi:MAG TPA: hypothetical protein VKT32_03665, partial [Chthonomonadaceae bacterium]|nr:hypothetical protein [Chthonomonadaceae bacterium]
IYPYRFRDGDDFLHVSFDAVSGRLTAIETPAYAVSCCLPVEEAVAGETYPITWEITPRAGRPLEVVLLTELDADFALSVQERLVVERETFLTRDLRVAATAAPRQDGEDERRIRSTLLLDGQPVVLEMGVKVVRPIEIGFSGQGLFAGREEPVRIRLRNRLDRPLTGTLALDPHPALRCQSPEQPFALPARSWTSCLFTVSAQEAGVLESQLRYQAGEIQGSRPVAFRAFTGGGALASVDPQEETAVLETPGLRLEVSLRGGWISVQDTARDRQIMGVAMAELGPPFPGWRMRPLLYSARVESTPTGTGLVLSAASPEFPGLIVERSLRLAGEGLVRMDHRVVNTTGQSQALKLRYRPNLWLGGYITLPLPDGLLQEPLRSWGEYPESDRDVLAHGQKLAESWMACEEEGMVCGILWAPEHETEVERGVRLTQDMGEVPPHGVSMLPPVYLVASGGDWKRVRSWWRRLIAPTQLEEEAPPQPARAIEVKTDPSPLFLTSSGPAPRLVVRNRRGRQVSGQLTLAGQPFTAEPSAFSLEALDREHPFETSIAVTGPAAPAAGFLEASLANGLETTRYRLPVIQPGAGKPVQVREDGEGTLAIENGFLRLRCAPAHLGALIALERNGVNHLFSSYPAPGPFEQYNPWFGGVHPYINWIGESQRMAKERFDGTPVERTGECGLLWKGVRVASDLEDKEWRFARLEIEYLTLPGSNLAAVVSRWINRTEARHQLYCGMVAWVQPGGTRANAVSYWEQEGKRRHRGRGGFLLDIESGPWAAVENPETGDMIAFLAGDPRDHINVVDLGVAGPHLLAGYNRWLEPGGSVEVLSWLVLCADPGQLDAYAALAQCSRLP